MNLLTQIEKWHAYWQSATDPTDVERQLRKLRWLETFAFHSGNAIQTIEFSALQQQIESGEKKLAELYGDFTATQAHVSAQQQEWVSG